MQSPGLNSKYTESEFLGAGPGNLHLTSIVGDSDVDQLVRTAMPESPPSAAPVRARYTGRSRGMAGCPDAHRAPVLRVQKGLGTSCGVREKEVLFIEWVLMRGSILLSNTFQFI